MTEAEIATTATPGSEDFSTASMVRQIAHDLRQPLSTIESIAYYLNLILPQTEERARCQLEKLQQLVEQSNWIVSNALYFTQAAPRNPQPLGVAALLDEALLESSATFLVNRVDAGLAVRMDRTQASHMIRNLLTLFERLASESLPLVVTASEDEALLQIRFHTDAYLYSEYEVRLMFEPNGTPLTPGDALSLAAVMRIIQGHRGEVEFDVAPESGTAITLVLPR